MKKILMAIFLTLTFISYADEEGFGIIGDTELKAVGVKVENIDKAKKLMKNAANSYKVKVLERRQLELQVNEFVLDNPEKNLLKIDALFDKMSKIDSDIMKERIRNQIQMQKYITQEQYTKAKELAVKKMNK